MRSETAGTSILETERTASGAEPLAVLRGLAEELLAEELTVEEVHRYVQQLIAGHKLTTPIWDALHCELDGTLEHSPLQGQALAQVLCYAAQGLDDALRVAQSRLLLAGACNLCGDFARAIVLTAQARNAFLTLDDAANAACSDLERALAQLCLGRYDAAQQQIDQALVAFEQLDLPQQAAHAQRLLAKLHMELGEYERALALCQEVRCMYEQAEDAIGVAHCDLDLAAICLYQNRYDEAWKLLQPLAPIFEHAGLPLDLAHTLRFAGLVYTQRNEYDEAENALRQAQDIYAQVGNDFEIARCERSQANVSRARDRLQEAADHCRRALRIFESYGHEVAVARCDHTLGVLQYALNRYPEAKESYERAAKVFDKHGLRVLAAASGHSIGLVLARMGDYNAALAAYERAKEILVEQRLPVYLGHCLESMAAIHIRLGQYERALALARNAHEIMAAEGLTTNAARFEVTLAHACHKLGDAQQAIRWLDSARRHFAAEGMEISGAFCDKLAADVHVTAGDLPLALSLYQAARRTFRQHDLPVDGALCRLAEGNAHLHQGEDEQAAGAFSEALAGLGSDFPAQSWQAEYGLAQVARQQTAQASEATHLRRAITYLEQVRQTIYTEEHASSFFASCQHVYHEALASWLALGNLEAGLEVAEAGKGSVLRWLLNHQAAALADTAVDDAYLSHLLRRQRVLRGEIEGLRHRLDAAAALTGPGLLSSEESPSEWLEDLNRFSQLGREHAALFAQIRRAHAGYALFEPGEPFSLASLRTEMSHQFPAGWGCLVYSFFQEGRLAVFYLDNEMIKAWVRDLDPITRLALQQCASPARDERELIYGGTLRGHGTPRPLGGTHLHRLYDLLIPKAVRKRLNPERLLLIVPHGVLHYLPFHALLDGEAGDACLLQEAVVVYAPSLHIWQTLLTDQRRSATALQGGALSEQERCRKPLLLGLSAFGRRAGPLLQAEEEAATLWELFDQRGDLFLGPAASREMLSTLNASGALRSYDLLHFATHAVFDAGAPLQSRVLLHDGDLMVSDVFRLRLSAPLVTLSACQSGVTQPTPGDELLGLPQAFFFAGARSLLASLWTVDDRSTARLMTSFYQAWQRGVRPAWALAAAQRAMIEEKVSPYHWASFLLLGIP